MIVSTPVADFTGEVVGVRFEGGVASVPDDSPVLAYFARHGYRIEPEPKAPRKRAPRT